MDLDKLLKIGDRCIHDEPPVCVGHCPLHIDIREFMANIEKGNFKKAYKTLEKRMPFTRIFAKICDHPCEKSCVRQSIGGSINISELEKAVVEIGYTPPKKRLSMPKKNKKVAIIGGGISGIIAAYDLDRKGYLVSIYEKTDKIGGRIWGYENEELKKEIIEEELEVLNKSDIDINLNIQVDNEKLNNIVKEYDAIYLTVDLGLKDEIDLITFQLGDTNIFVGGFIIDKKSSVIFSVSNGRRGAISIDRYLSKVSLTASREREGVFETPLKYNIDDEEILEKVEKTGIYYTADEAIEEAKRCFKCRCIECIKTCSHLQTFDIAPNAYIRQINQSERIILGTHYANKMINSCTLCGLCGERCFLDINMKDIIQETRESMVLRGKMPISAHDFALKDMKFSNSNRFSMVKKQPSREESKDLFYYPLISYSKYVQGLYRGTGKTKYLFYPGCQLPASMPEYISEIYKYLIGNIKEDVGIFLGCCGAPANWGGRKTMLEENIKNIKDVWHKMEEPTFILACSSCYEIFGKYMPEINCISLWEIFDKYGLPSESRKVKGYTLNVHDACSTRYNEKIHNATRNITKALGYEIAEFKHLKEEAKCCGYGGLVYYANRDQTVDFIEDRKKESTKDMLVYCAMCKDLFIREGKRAFHILDLIFAEDLEKSALRKMPNLSERHFNRTQVKIDLLKEFWGEDAMGIRKGYDFEINIPKEIMDIMEDRFILVEDIKQVIENAEKTGGRFYNPENSNYLAKLRLEDVTYWVQYKPEKNYIQINRVYSHRMEVIEE